MSKTVKELALYEYSGDSGPAQALRIAYTLGANAVLEEIEFAMRLGSADHVSLAAVKECIKNLKGDDK